MLYQLLTEKLLSLTIGNIRFIDSFAFLIESWDNVVQNIYANDNDDRYLHFNDMKRFYGEYLDLMCNKGIYPYAWVRSFDKHGLCWHTTNRRRSFITEARHGEQTILRSWYECL